MRYNKVTKKHTFHEAEDSFMKKSCITLALLLSLLLIASASAQARLPDGFETSGLISIYNDQLVKSFMAVKPTETATKVNLYRTYGMTAEGGSFRFNSKDGKVTLIATFPEDVTDPSGPAEALAFTVAGDVDPLDYPVLKDAFANAIARADGEADPQALLAWMNSATKGGEALALNGYTLTYTRDGSARTYTLVPDEADSGDALPEPKAEPGSESGPDDLPEPEPESGSGPDDLPEPEPKAEEPTPEQAPTRQAQAGTGALLSWKGFEITPLRTERWQFSSGNISLKLFVRVVNGTGGKLTLHVEDMTVDGVALPATSIFDIKAGADTGENSEECILIYVDENITDSAVQAVLHGSDMSMKLILYDSEAYQALYTQEVAVDLGALPNETTIMEPSDAPAPTPTPTKAPVSSVPVPERNVYKPLFEGDKGEDVRRMQRRLIELGYLNDTADGEYGPRTDAAVRAFCEANGLGAYPYASASMLELMYSSYATPYQEPWVPLVFQAGAWAEWRNVKNDRLGFHAKVTNTSRTHTVKAFEMYTYATDVWGDRIYGEDIYRGTTSKTIKPGKSVYSDYFLLPNRSRIAKVWCGIKKVIFDDGTIRENDTVDYTSWTIK